LRILRNGSRLFAPIGLWRIDNGAITGPDDRPVPRPGWRPRATTGSRARERRVKAVAREEAYWRATVQLTASILLVCGVVTFVIGFFARDLGFRFSDWPFSFYLGAQGAPVVYCLLIWWYARRMDSLDREAGVDEDEAEELGGPGPSR
jgi:putative solute:sodium symporter small subunit